MWEFGKEREWNYFLARSESLNLSSFHLNPKPRTDPMDVKKDVPVFLCLATLNCDLSPFFFLISQLFLCEENGVGRNDEGRKGSEEERIILGTS